ncbi:MAG TPA: haloacid dehalogenase type II [Verrucomicrobiae bacterium]|nr:haloacid dehalogenase type II [Verrucomicrobiae bacterium]
MGLESVRFITFDCYGTLIDWETGILSALRQALPEYSHTTDSQLLEMYAESEVRLESGPYLSYREVLERVAEEIGRRLGTRLSAADCRNFAESIKDWRPFPDTVAGLRALAQKYRLGIISNVDDDLFAATQERLQVPFDVVVTAEQVRSYKPAFGNFHEAMKRSGVKKEEMLHAAESLYHDIAPANSLGLSNVWVNRRFGKHGFGATTPGDAQPSYEVHSLAELAAMMTASN